MDAPDGPLLATLKVPPGVKAKEVVCRLDREVTGVHDVYIRNVATKESDQWAILEWFTFE